MQTQPHSPDEFHKFHTLEEEKQERVINAAMKEFLVGYKKASTDNIVREAGISKGLLFHYFGTKEGLYNYLIDHGVDIIMEQFLGLINVNQADVLESLWQLALLKQDLSMQFPSIFDFLTSTYMHTGSTINAAHGKLDEMVKMRARIMEDIYNNGNHDLFREDIDPKKAIDIITWAVNGYTQSLTAIAPAESLGESARENYDKYLNDLKEMLDLFRKCFYKEELL